MDCLSFLKIGIARALALPCLGGFGASRWASLSCRICHAHSSEKGREAQCCWWSSGVPCLRGWLRWNPSVARCMNAGHQVLSWSAVTSLGSQSLPCRWTVSVCSGRCHRILQTGQPVDGRRCVSCAWSCKSKMKVLAFSVSGEPSSHWGLAWGKGEGARGLFREGTGAG